MKKISYEVYDRQYDVLQEFANMKYDGNLQKAINHLISSGFKFNGYGAGSYKGKPNLHILTHAEHQEYLTKAIKMD
tara:strand:+ start:266 stop:493 length:228 start_codon:yes stop_codon:yes gene_type:complete